MVKIVHTTGFLACLAMAALVGACGDDDNGNNNGFDAPPSGGVDALTSKTYGFALTKGAEVPVCANAGANAGGTASVTVNAENTMIMVTVNFSGLSSAATVGHIHAGVETASGPPVLNFVNPPTTPINKTFTAADYPSPAPSGAPATFAAFMTDLRDGKAYINIHTGMCSGGEIRGQIK